MRYVAQSAAVAGLVAVIGTGAWAQDAPDPATMTCADFAALTPEEQSEALSAIETAAMEAEAGAAAEGEAAAGAEAAAGMEGEAAAEAEAPAEMAEGDAAAGAEAGAEVDPEVQALLDACEGNDDALAMDQLPPA